MRNNDTDYNLDTKFIPLQFVVKMTVLPQTVFMWFVNEFLYSRTFYRRSHAKYEEI